MNRVAIIAPVANLRTVLVAVADAGTVEVDEVLPAVNLAPDDATKALRRLTATAITPRLAWPEPDLGQLERSGSVELLAGEAALSKVKAQAVVQGEVAAIVGWTPKPELAKLAERLSGLGGALVPLRRPRGVDPPTAPGSATVQRAFAPLVTTYGTAAYADLDPTVLAGASYAVMFGAMFGDVGHGAVLLLGAAIIRFGRWRRLAPLRPHWLLIAVAALCAIGFGFAYGECFGPTGLVPAGVIAPIDQPVAMLVGGVALGVLLLGVAFAVGIANRLREGGWALALYAASGIAGAAVFVAGGIGIVAWYWRLEWLGLAAGLLGLLGLSLAYIGLYARAGGGASGAAQAGIETFDLVTRMGTNVVSFARLAAFGLTHAVLTWIVWMATVALWHTGLPGAVVAPIIFGLGNAVAFALEALVAGIQALRLEYYELFSRVYLIEGRPFQPWHIPAETFDSTTEAVCRPGSSSLPSSAWAYSARRR